MKLARALPLLLLLACSDSLGPGTIVLSVIDANDKERPAVFKVPSTTQVGIPFRVDFAIFHHHSCGQHAYTDVTTTGLLIDISPYTHRASGNCTDIGPSRYIRSVALQFSERGAGRIVLHGWSSVTNDTIAVERFIVVR